MAFKLTGDDFTSGAYSDNDFRYHIKKGFTEEEMRQILKDHKKAGDVEWLYRKVHYLQRINKRLGEQLLDTDKRNIHIKPWHWKEICERAKKWATLISSYPEWEDWSLLPTQLNQLVKDAKYGHELRKRLEDSKK